METARLRAGFALFCAVFLVACTPEPIPELLAAVAPNAATPAIVSGPTLQPCVEDRLPVTVAAAEYSPTVTYKMAELIQRNFKKGAQFAPNLRAYTALVVNKGLFGQEVRRKLACYYVLENGTLTYVAHILADEDFRVEISTFTSTGDRIYRKLSGDSRLSVFFGL